MLRRRFENSESLYRSHSGRLVSGLTLRARLWRRLPVLLGGLPSFDSHHARVGDPSRFRRLCRRPSNWFPVVGGRSDLEFFVGQREPIRREDRPIEYIFSSRRSDGGHTIDFPLRTSMLVPEP